MGLQIKDLKIGDVFATENGVNWTVDHKEGKYISASSERVKDEPWNDKVLTELGCTLVKSKKLERYQKLYVECIDTDTGVKGVYPRYYLSIDDAINDWCNNENIEQISIYTKQEAIDAGLPV